MEWVRLSNVLCMKNMTFDLKLLCEDLAPSAFDPSLSNVSVGLVKNSIISKVIMNAITFAIDLPQIIHLTLKLDIIELGV